MVEIVLRIVCSASDWIPRLRRGRGDQYKLHRDGPYKPEVAPPFCLLAPSHLITSRQLQLSAIS